MILGDLGTWELGDLGTWELGGWETWEIPKADKAGNLETKRASGKLGIPVKLDKQIWRLGNLGTWQLQELETWKLGYLGDLGT